MIRQTLLATVIALGTAGVASASPIDGSFSLVSLGGSYVGGTALTATGLDFGAAMGGSGNGYGTNGTAFVGNAVGSFVGLASASIADISLGLTANPYQTNPFLSFAGSNIVFNFSDATLTRLSNSITVTGTGTFTDGIAADTNTGIFSLSTNNQTAAPTEIKFTFTGNGSSVSSVPEPVSMSILGAGLLGMGAIRMRRKS